MQSKAELLLKVSPAATTLTYFRHRARTWTPRHQLTHPPVGPAHRRLRRRHRRHRRHAPLDQHRAHRRRRRHISRLVYNKRNVYSSRVERRRGSVGYKLCRRPPIAAVARFYRQHAPSRVLVKRAFDRLEASPFEWGTLTKRYSDADVDELYGAYRAKKSFDRLDSHSFGVLKRKRAFDRAESGIGAFHIKRSIGEYFFVSVFRCGRPAVAALNGCCSPAGRRDARTCRVVDKLSA